MKKEGYYSSGQFAKMAHVSVRTIRFYDQKHLLKPSYVSESGARFYTDYDFVKLQQILLLKYLGFSLDDIKEMSTGQQEHYFLKNALTMQKKLIEQRLEEMEQVKGAIDTTLLELEGNEEPDWKSIKLGYSEVWGRKGGAYYYIWYDGDKIGYQGCRTCTKVTIRYLQQTLQTDSRQVAGR